MSIRVLERDVIAGISAGEVVERPASVVKELVENSIDAGATRIRVEIVAAGMKLIRVADNGAGIPGNEALLSFQRHATSKLRSLDDLSRIMSFGFRGEALAAIASAGNVQMLTRTAQTQEGAKVIGGPGLNLSQSPTGCEQGTDIRVTDLFLSIPARLKFLRSPSAETTSVVRVIEPYVLAHPSIHFQLTIDEQERINAPPSSDATKRLRMILGSSADALLAFTGVRGACSISGFVQAPGSINRRGKAWFLVNGRPIEDRSLRHGLASSYASELPKGSYPTAVVYLTLPPERVDVNVHPAKTQVRFADPQDVYQLLVRSVRTSFAAATPTVKVPPKQIHPADPDSSRTPPHGPSITEALFGPSTPALTPSIRPPMLLRDGALDADFQVLGQFFNTYILAMTREGILLVDQHAAHEKILYERLARRDGTRESQSLLVPQTMDLAPSEAATLNRFADSLAQAGFEFDSFGGNAIVLRAIPSGASDGDAAGLFVELIESLAESGNVGGGEDILHRIRSTIACHSAIRGGERLAEREMAALITELMALKNPLSCPHGRPTFISLDESALARMFHRPPEAKE